MIVIRNMFMVKKLFVVSFLIFVMSLSSVFAMEIVNDQPGGETEEKEHSDENFLEKNLNNITNSQSGEFFVPMDNNEKFQGNPMVNSGSMDKKTYLMSRRKQITGQSQFLQGSNQPVQGYNQAVQGYYPNTNSYYPNPNQNPYYQNSNNQDPNNQNPNNMYQVPTGMPPVYVDVTQQTIFGYRRVIFLFWSPLICNSLLNYIFELDNKPSGGFLGMFFSGWRSRTFLRFMSFDVHFNTVLFLASSFCDVFVYRNRNYIQKSNKNGVYFLLFDLVFNAFSLCVNFKVDDYFYITVNLSYFLRAFVDRYAGFNGGFFDYIKYSITGGNTLGSGPIMPYDKGEKLEEDNKGTNQIQPKYDQNEEKIDNDNDTLQDQGQDTGSGAGGE